VDQLKGLGIDLSNLAELPNIKKALDKIPNEIVDQLRRRKKEEEGPLDWFMKLGDPRNVPKIGFPNVPDVDERRLFVPAFEG
jgi:hypothetical protein